MATGHSLNKRGSPEFFMRAIADGGLSGPMNTGTCFSDKVTDFSPSIYIVAIPFALCVIASSD